MIVLDEPFSALDTSLRAQAREAVTRVLEASGVTAVLVTHDQTEALTFGDNVGVLERGRLIQAGPPRVLFDDPCTPAIAGFFADACFLEATLGGDEASTAFGRVGVRHCHSTAVGDTRIMVRPNQFTVDTLSAAPNARVLDVTWAGAVTRIVLRPINRAHPVTIEVPAEHARYLHVGDLIEARLVGTAVAYDSAPAGQRTRGFQTVGAAQN